jgi:hypothetical protein
MTPPCSQEAKKNLIESLAQKMADVNKQQMPDVNGAPIKDFSGQTKFVSI